MCCLLDAVCCLMYAGCLLEALCAFGVLFGPRPPHEERRSNRILGPRGGVRGGVLSAVCWKSAEWYAVCWMLFVVWCMLVVGWSALVVVCCLLDAVCFLMYAVCRWFDRLMDGLIDCRSMGWLIDRLISLVCWSVLVVVCCLLDAVCCLMYAGWWLKCVGCRMLFVGCWLLFYIILDYILFSYIVF